MALAVLILTLLPTISMAIQNQLCCSKVTILKGNEARAFHRIFPKNIQHSLFSSSCVEKNDQFVCKISSQRTGFAGDIPNQLLNGRKKAEYASPEADLRLSCGTLKTPKVIQYCNISQRHSVLI